MASVLFCRNCGNLLINNGEDIIECNSCTSKHSASGKHEYLGNINFLTILSY